MIMKKGLLVLLVAVLAVVSSCSKDAKINRRLDGEWNVVSIGGVVTEATESYTMKFIKEDKLTGNGTLTYTFMSQSYTDAFTYSVLDQKITLILDGTAEMLSVTKYDKDRMEMIDTNGDLWVLDPK
jgi:hypothetical protein